MGRTATSGEPHRRPISETKPLARRMLHWWRDRRRLGLGFGSQGGFPVTHLRQSMLDELQRRNYSPNIVRSYLHAVEGFARHFRRSPEQLGPDHVREYQVHLFRDRKLSARTVAGQTAALRFLFVKTLRRPYLPDALPFPKLSRRLPTVLSQEEIARLIDATGNLMHRAMVMTLYATGVRRAELCRLKVADIDSQRVECAYHLCCRLFSCYSNNSATSDVAPPGA